MSAERLHLDYLVIGHVTQDLTDEGPCLGGTAAYSSLTADALGQRVGVITAAAPDVDLTALQGLKLAVTTTAHTTTFENRSTPSGRAQTLHARATPLTEKDIPPEWLQPTIVHLAPVADEVPRAMAARFPDSTVGISLQGWLRTWDSSGRVTKKDWRPWSDSLHLADVVLCSTEDLMGGLEQAREIASHCRLLVVTDGPQGAHVFWKDALRHCPTTPAEEVDSTGAGDIFAAAFIIRYVQTGNPWGAADFANHLATASIQRRGVHGVPSSDEVAAAFQTVRP